MVDGAMQTFQHLGGHLEDFLGKTKAITLAFTGDELEVYAHHVQPTEPPSNDIVVIGAHYPGYQYHQFRLQKVVVQNYEGLKLAQTIVRNAQDIGFDLAMQLRELIRNPQSALTQGNVEASNRSIRSPARHNPTPSTSGSVGEPPEFQ